MNLSFPIFSLWQIWADLVVRALKKYETRGWATDRRGLVVIHAAQRPFRLVDYGGRFPQIIQELQLNGVLPTERKLAYGAAIGVAEIVDCQPVAAVRDVISVQELAFGDYRDVDEKGRSRFAIRLENARRFARPIPLVGKQTVFWNWTPSGGDMDILMAALNKEAV